jgi:uncharacterized protein
VLNLTTRPLQLKRAAADTGTFSGLAAAWSSDRDGDQFEPGAFHDTLNDWAARGGNIPLLVDHDPGQPIGSIIAAAETAEGLEVTAQLAIDTEDGAEAYALLKSGALSLSVGFTIPAGGATSGEEGDGRVITRADLYEVSLVSLPANADAIVSSVKRYSSAREFEKAARHLLHLSARQAKKLAAVAWPMLAGADSEPDEDALAAEAARTAALAETERTAALAASAKRIEQLVSQI